METMTESGGVIPHHHHHNPISGSNYFPTKDQSPPSYFFPSNAGSQSVYRGYGGGGGGGGGGVAGDLDTQSRSSSSGMLYGGGIVGVGGGGGGGGGQNKSLERRESEERGGGGGGRVGEGRRSNSSGGGGGVIVPPGSSDNYYPASSSTSSSSSSHPLQQPPYHHHSFQQQQQQQQQSPHRGINQFLPPHQQQQQQRLEEVEKMSSTSSGKLPADGHQQPTIPDTNSRGGRNSDQSSSLNSPEKQRLAKDGNSIGGNGSNLPYDNGMMMTSPYYNNYNTKRQHPSGFMNNDVIGRKLSGGPGYDPNNYMADVRDSVKEVYDSFMHSRNKEGSGGGKPEAIPVAYDDSNEMQSQNFREKLERSTSQDAAAVAARNSMTHRNMNSHEYNNLPRFEGGGSGGSGDHRPRAITMNSMYNRRDQSPSSLHINNPYGGGGNNKNHDLYTKMREHFNRSEAMKNPYYYLDKDKEADAGREGGVGGGISPMSPLSSSYMSPTKHPRRPSGGHGSGSDPNRVHPMHAQSSSSSSSSSRQESLNRMMMVPPSSNASSSGDKFHHHHHQQQQQHQQQEQHHRSPYHPNHPMNQAHHNQLPESDDPHTRPSQHHSTPRKSIDSINEIGIKTPTGSEATPPRSRSPYPTSSSSTTSRKSPMISLSPSSEPATTTQKLWPQPSSSLPSSSSGNASAGPQSLNSKYLDRSRSLSGENHTSSSTSQPKFPEKEGSTTDQFTTTPNTNTANISSSSSPNGDTSENSCPENIKNKSDNDDMLQNYSSRGDNDEEETGLPAETDSTNNTPSKLDSTSSSLSPKGDDVDVSPSATPSRKRSSSDSPDDTSLPDALPRELMPKKEILSDGEDGDDSFHSSSAHYPPMTPPSPSSSSGLNSSYPPSFPPHHPLHHHHHQQQQPHHPNPHHHPRPHPHHQNQQPFFPSPERLPPNSMPHASFGSPRGLQDGGGGGGGHGMPPGFPFAKDLPVGGGGRFPMPGLARDLPLGVPPGGSPFMGGHMPNLMGGADKNVYFCHLCNYSGKSKPDFDIHMSVHFEYNCPHCDYTSRTEGRLKRHIKDFHTDENGRRSMPGRPKVFKCKQCSFSATEKDKFWEHARSHIKEDKLLQCPKCPFVTEYKHHLEYHLRNHFGSKPFKCNKCNYSCVNKSMLNSHMKSHTNVYQYRCSDCTYATKYCHSLKLHLRKYNHKPATVLNQDGSLPQGADADASGLAISTKRGPPRGPRVPRKDKGDPYFSQMFGMPPLPMGLPPGMNPMLKGMMPFWSVMPPSGIPGHPAMMAGLPNMPHAQHMGLRGDNLDMRGVGGVGDRDRGDRPGLDRNNSDPEMNGMMSGENSPIKDDDEVMYLPCRLCDFVGEGTEALCLHLLQAHKDETGEMASMYGISETALAENMERAKKNKFDKTPEQMMMERRRMSEMSSDSELDMSSEYRRRNTIAGLLSRENTNFGIGRGGNNDKPFWSPSNFGGHQREKTDDGRIQDLCYVDDGNDDGDNENEHAVGGMDILQQMTLKFGGAALPTTERSKSLDAELIRSAEEKRERQRVRENRNEEDDGDDDDDDNANAMGENLRKHHHGHKESSPLDLTKPKSVSPPMFSNPSSPRRVDEFNSDEDDDSTRSMWKESGRVVSELDKVTEHLARKRQFSEAEDGSYSGNTAAAIAATTSDLSTIVPRKRSRKGKAYKLETLCLKLQERKNNSPNDSDEMDSENDFNSNPEQLHYGYDSPQTKMAADDINTNNNSDENNVIEKETDDDYHRDDNNKNENDDNDNDKIMDAGTTKEPIENDDCNMDDDQTDILESDEKFPNKEEVDERKKDHDDDDDENKIDSDVVKKEIIVDLDSVKDEPAKENETENVKKDEADIGDEHDDKDDEIKNDCRGEKIKKELETDEPENAFEKLQETLKSLNKELSDDEKEVEENKEDDKSSRDNQHLSEEEKVRKESENMIEKFQKKYFGYDNDNDDDINDDNIKSNNKFDNDDDDDDDDDDAKTEILGGEDLSNAGNIFDLSDKENSNDPFRFENNVNNVTSSPNQKPQSEEVQIEDKVDMINTVIENRKKPLPPAVRRGTELAWKLLNDPVNPVTSIPIPVVSPPPPEWNNGLSPQRDHRPISPMTSPLAANNNISGGSSNSVGGGLLSPSAPSHLTSNMSSSPMKNGIRTMSNPIPPFNNQSSLPPPSHPGGLNLKQHQQQQQQHIPIPLPPTPMAYIPPTNRMLPEHMMPRPPLHQSQLPHPGSHVPPPPMHMANKPGVTKDAMYECNYCDLSFRDCVMYTVHMGYHSNRNPFKCNSCGIICRDKVEFFLHMARSPHS